jgi:4'-phosphopantetheinyl transferase
MISALPFSRDDRADGPAWGRTALSSSRHLGSPLSVDLWLADLDGVSDDASTPLDDVESTRAGRFVFDRDRHRYIAAHRLLRELLAMRNGIPAAAMAIAVGPHGKPHLVDRPCAFNLSHSGGVVLIGIADNGEVGVDVEVLRPTPELDALVRSHFSAGERRAMESVAHGARDLAFLVGWTRKEACLKAVGVGLDIDPASIDAGIGVGARSLRIESAEVDATVVVQSLVWEGRAVCAVARTRPP